MDSNYIEMEKYEQDEENFWQIKNLTIKLMESAYQKSTSKKNMETFYE